MPFLFWAIAPFELMKAWCEAFEIGGTEEARHDGSCRHLDRRLCGHAANRNIQNVLVTPRQRCAVLQTLPRHFTTDRA